MKVSELQGNLAEVKAIAIKSYGEIRGKIDQLDAKITLLESQLGDADVPEETVTTLTELKAIHKDLDDIVPDAEELPPPVEPEPTEPA